MEKGDVEGGKLVKTHSLRTSVRGVSNHAHLCHLPDPWSNMYNQKLFYTESTWYDLFSEINIFFFSEMALTVDQMFDKIGSFGRYQKLLLLGCNGLVFFWFGFPVLIMTFITPDPGWKCVANSSECTFNETSLLPSDKRRCDLNRSEWTFTDDFTSVATEVIR